MNTKQNFQLIAGTFTPDQAGQVIGALLKSKIDYHILENHSERERSGIANHSGERLAALRALDADLKKTFATAKASGLNLKIEGSITITPVA